MIKDMEKENFDWQMGCYLKGTLLREKDRESLQ